MARYAAFLGRRVAVQYRAGDVCLPASGTFVADSGRSIFLEQHFELRGQPRHFRWEIPYQYIVRIELIESPESATAPATAAPKTANQREAAAKDPATEPPTKNAASAAAGAGGASSLLSLPMRPKRV